MANLSHVFVYTNQGWGWVVNTLGVGVGGYGGGCLSYVQAR